MILMQAIFACIKIIKPRYFLYIRGWFSNLFDALLLEKLKSNFLLSSMKLLLKILLVTLFRDGLLILKRNTGSRLRPFKIKYRKPHVKVRVNSGTFSVDVDVGEHRPIKIKRTVEAFSKLVSDFTAANRLCTFT
jgi:hypothetical protein